MHTTRSPYSFFLALVSLGTIVVIVLTGCQPGPTPTHTPTSITEPVTTPLPSNCEPIIVSNGSGQTILTLPDGSQIYLADYTEIEFTPAGYCQGVDEHHILLKQGAVAIHSLLPVGRWIVVSNPDGYLAQLSETGLVIFDPEGQLFTLACTNGTCALGTNAENLTSLGCGESADLDADGKFSGPFNVDPAMLVEFGEWLQPKCAPARTSTPRPSTATPTPDTAATATAFCASFHSQFALTPCPPYNP